MHPAFEELKKLNTSYPSGSIPEKDINIWIKRWFSILSYEQYI